MFSAPLPYHLSQLAALCREYPADEKVVFVPSLQIGHNLGTALSRRGVAWVNLRLTTPARWADRVVGRAFEEDGRRPLVPDVDAFFILHSLESEKWPENHPLAGGYSAEGFAATLLKTIRALRLAGVQPGDLPRAATGIEGMLGRQYAAYCAWIDEEGFYDRADIFRRATWEAHCLGSIFAILDETPLTECAYEFVRECSGGDIRRIGRQLYGAPPPEHSAGMRFSSAPIQDGGGYVGPGGRLLTTGLSENDQEHVALRSAVGAENEVRGVLRELLSHGVALDEIEIAYTSEQPYLTLLVEETERLGLAATFGAGVPVWQTRPGQALLGFLRWISSGFDPDELVRLFRSRLIYSRSERDAVDIAAAAGILLEARLAPGRYAWRAGLDGLITRLSIREEDGGGEGESRYLAFRRQKALRLKQYLEALTELCPPGGKVSLGTLVGGCLAFLNRFAAWEGDRDVRARESLEDRLKGLAEAVFIADDPSRLASMLSELLRSHKVEAAVARPGSLYIVPLERAGYSDRAETVIVGMAEPTFPGPALEDPILLDNARARFGGKLRLQRAGASDPTFHLVRALGASAGRCRLTTCIRDAVDGREIYPAAVIEQAKEQLNLEALPVYSFVPEPADALTESEIALAMRATSGFAEEIGAVYPWMMNGRTAMSARELGEPGIYTGWLGEATPELHPGAESAISASRLEDLATCPYRYFLKNVLHVRPPDVPDRATDRWLSAMEFGALLHEVLKTFMELIADREEVVDADRHASLMEEVLESVIDRYKERIPVHFEAAFRADRHRLARTVRVFLTEETRRQARPVGFEVSFGMGKSGGLEYAEPVKIRLSDGMVLSLRGAIDRIDKTESGYEIWDYKTGSTYNFEEHDLLSGGQRLQWALYAFALEDILREKGIAGSVTQSGYFFASDREHGLRLWEEPPEREEVARQLKPLFDLAAKGAFLHVQKTNACTFCDYAEICAGERAGIKRVDEFEKPTHSEHDFMDDLEEWMECSR